MKKVIAISFVMVLTLGLFSGCKPKSTTANSNDSAFTLSIVCGSTENYATAIKAWTKLYPKAKVQIINAPWTNDGGLATKQKELLLIASNQTPDLGKMVWGKEFYDSGLLVDITNQVKSWPVYKDLTQGQLDRMSIDGHIFGLTQGNNCIYMFYNKDILSKAGISQPPATMDELQADAAKIKAANLKGSDGKSVYSISFEGGNWSTDYWLWTLGGQQMNDNYTKAMINSPASIKAFQFLQDFVKNGYAPKLDGSGNALWMNGKVAFWPTGSWDIKGSDDAKLNFGVTLLPKGSDGKTTVSIGGVELGVFKASKHQQAAIDFLKVLTDKDVQIGDGRPIDQAMYDDPQMQATFKATATMYLEGMTTQAKQLSAGSKWNFLEAPYSFSSANTIYADAMTKILTNLDNVTDVMNDAAKQIDDGIAANK